VAKSKLEDRGPVRIGIVGTGVISGAYLNAAKAFRQVKVTACADLVPDNARRRAEEFKIRACEVDELLADPDIDLVLNLTIPQSHVPVSLRAVEAGKHAYSEKPLGLSVREAKRLLDAAAARGVRVGCAPDTFLGAGQQSARKAIDDGLIGEPIGGTAFIMIPGHESWHPNPEFYYQPGGGPVFDMGPYYLTALVNLLGPIKSVVSFGRKSFNHRVVGNGPKQGKKFKVEILTHFTALLEFLSGPVVTFGASFDVQSHTHGPIEIYGTKGSLQVPDPNQFPGAVRIFPRWNRWGDLHPVHGYGDSDYRMLGVAEMASAIRHNLPHRASDRLALHVLEVMEAIVEGSKQPRVTRIRSRCERPRPLATIAQGGDLR
jgi:predicted dehydrogenase